MEKSKYSDNTDRLYRPAHQSKLQAFRFFLYNPDNKSFLGRTCSSWAKILTFYVIFYAVLACFFAVCMWGLLQTIDENAPTYQLDDSIIGSSPGLSSRPMPPEGRESLLTFNTNKHIWVDAEWEEIYDEFLQEYQKPLTGANECSYGSAQVPCAVDVTKWANCTPSGTKLSGNCLFFKINKVIDWEPKYFADSELPEEMPQDLKDTIKNTSANEKKKIWLSCEGRTDDDKQNLGKVSFFPEQGFPGYYYPFKRQKAFRSPVVALLFNEPALNTEINMECRAWAANIHQDRKEQLGVLNYKLKFE